jgi:predicted NACHT family NTPase
MSDEIKALATNMVGRKKSGADPYILFLGAGASISSGASSMMQIVDDVLESQDSKQFDELQVTIQKAASINSEYGELKRQEINRIKRDQFFKIWRRLDHESQYAILRKHLWENKTPSDGYVDLAHLIKLGYIKMILSTNLDNLLEKSLRSEDLYPPEDFIVIKNG